MDISAPHIILPEDFKNKQTSLVSTLSIYIEPQDYCVDRDFEEQNLSVFAINSSLKFYACLCRLYLIWVM